MSTYEDSARDAADLAKLVNEDTDVTTRYGTNPKVSAPKAIRLIETSGTDTVNQIQTDAANAIATLNTSRGFRDVGAFSTGFTYELPNDVAVDGSGNYWAYADVSALPVTVTAGTIPTEGEYSQRTWNEASAIVTTAGINAQEFINNFELKIFQSPTDNLTKVSTFAGGVGVVYEVRKVSDNSLATIYSDKDGVTSIPQNGTSNVSNGDAEAVFYIDDGDYYIEVGVVSSIFKVLKLKKVVVGDDNYQPRVLACAIRNTGSGWAFINDPSHEPIGFTGIETLPDGRIRLDHAVGAVEVGGLVVCADETFAKRGVIAGASVGLSSSFIDVSSILNFNVDIANASVTSDPMWDGDISAAIIGGVCSITHPECGGGDTPSTTPIGGLNPRTDVSLSYSSVQTNIITTSDIDGYISYNGTAWVYAGDMVDAPTMAWDAGESELVVTHVISDTTNISINERAGGLTAKPDSVSSTFFQVKFYDSSGVLVSSPTTDMKFFFNRKGYARTGLRDGNFAVKRGYAKVDANKLISGSGNLWILGVQNT